MSAHSVPAATPQPSPEDRIQRWLAQDRSPKTDVSMETSPGAPAEPEPAAAAEETPEGEDYTPEPNAQLEGDEAEPEAEIRSFSDLAKRLEIEEDALAKHLVVAGRDGKEVSLHEVLTAYRAPAADPAIAERAQARMAELEARDADSARAAEELRRSAQALAAHVQQRMRSPQEWAQLKAENPTAYLLERNEHLEQVRQLEAADQQYRAAQQRQFEDQQRKVEEFRRGEARKLQAAVPAWSDPKAFEADLGKVEKYLTTQGIKPEEVANLTDHRDWLIARKAMLYDEIQAKKPALLEKLKGLPKVIAPGVSSGADRGNSARAKAADAEGFERLKASGKVEDAAALISRRLTANARRAAGRTLAGGRRS